MADVTITVGADVSRDEANLKDVEANIASYANAGDDVRVEVYADGVITQASMSWNETTITSSGTLHIIGMQDKFGNLPIIEFNTDGNHLLFNSSDAPGTITVEYLRLKGKQTIASGTRGVLGTTIAATQYYKNLEIWGQDSSGSATMTGIRLRGSNTIIQNCILHSGLVSGGGNNVGIREELTGGNFVINCTVFDFNNQGLQSANTLVAQNTVAVGIPTTNTFAGTFGGASSNNADGSGNAPGPDSITDVVIGDEFRSTDNTSVDFMRLVGNSRLANAGLRPMNVFRDLFGHNSNVGYVPNIGYDTVTLRGHQVEAGGMLI